MPIHIGQLLLLGYLNEARGECACASFSPPRTRPAREVLLLDPTGLPMDLPKIVYVGLPYVIFLMKRRNSTS